MKRTLLFILFTGIGLGIHAQVMDWGAPQKIIARNAYCKFVGNTRNAYYYLRGKKTDFKNDLTLEKYNRDLVLEWSKSLPLSRYSAICRGVLLTTEGIVVIESDENFNSGLTEVGCFTMNESGEVSSSYTGLFKVKTAAFYNDDDDERFMVRQNAAGTAFAVVYTLQPERKQPQTEYNIFSASGQPVTSGGYVYPLRADPFFINDVIFEHGNLFMLTSYHENGKRIPDGNYQHDVIRLLSSGNTAERISVSLENKIQSDLGIYYDTLLNRLQLTGFYSEKKSTSAAGVACYTLPDNSNTINSAFTPFPKELLAKIIGERNSEKEKEMEDFVVNKIVPRSDGGLILIAECYYIERQPYNTYSSGIQGIGTQQAIVRNVFNYDEVLVFSMRADAAIDWWQVIPKKQSTVNDFGFTSSIATLVKKDLLYIFFNLNYHNSNEVMEYSIRNNGKMKNRILFKSSSYYIEFAPRECRQISSGSILMPFAKDRKFNLLKLTY